jgi:hypothetical protein
MTFIHELGIRESVLNQPVFMVSDRLGFNGHFKQTHPVMCLPGLTPLCLSNTESLGLGVATWQQEAVGISRLRDVAGGGPPP